MMQTFIPDSSELEVLEAAVQHRLSEARIRRDLGSLNAAIAAMQEALSFMHDNYPRKPLFLYNLAMGFRQQFQDFRLQVNFEECIDALSEAAKLFVDANAQAYCLAELSIV